VAGIVSLYSTTSIGQCRFPVSIAAAVLQGVSLIFCLIAMAFAGWQNNSEEKDKNSSANSQRKWRTIGVIA
jgi:hypothetical protein